MEPIIIGVDTGNRCMKTAHNIFISGVEVSDKEMPFNNGVIIYKDKYYMLTHKRVAYLQDKTLSDEYFVLTLYAILNELETRHISTDEVIPIHLGVGLPPSHLPRLKDKFKQYFSRGQVDFKYNGQEYKLNILTVNVFSQGYAAIFMDFEQIRKFPKSYIIDIGGYTTDVMSLNNGKIDPEFCESLDLGLIQLYNQISWKVEKAYGMKPTETQIDDVIRTGEELDNSTPIQPIINEECTKYIDNLFRKLIEYGINLRFAKGIFIGGGSERLLPWIKKTASVSEPYVIRDIYANAQGYEACVNALLSRQG